MTTVHCSFSRSRCDDQASQSAAGFTLVELLVASTLALIVMAAVAQLFGVFSRGFSQAKDVSDLVSQMRSAAWKLRQDLQGVTVQASPWVRPESNAGYFELIEGPLKDSDAANGSSNLRADVDDILLFTTRSAAGAFSGRLVGGTFETPAAEVAWFCKPSPAMIGTQPLYTLYRRQLLVAGHVGTGVFSGSNTIAFTTWPAYYADNDVSCRRVGNTLFPNSLGDLSKRESRFLHNLGGIVGPTVFPYAFPADTIVATSANSSGEILAGSREGEDVVLRNVIAFDIQVFDVVSTGSARYVDLGALPEPLWTGTLSQPVNAKSRLSLPTYDTWSLHYEFNGIDDDSTLGIDQGTDGVDLTGTRKNDIVDDIDEFETAPPYDVPLRGLEVHLRCIEPSSKEIRQITVRHSFRGP